MSIKDLFLQSGQIVVGILLLVTVMWMGYNLWDVAIERWFG